MLWVLLFAGIAVAGLAVMAVLAVRLWRKLGALLEEVGVVADQADELFDLLAQVEVPEPGARHRGMVDDTWSSAPRT